MKAVLITLLFLVSLTSFGQGKRVYFVGDNQISVDNADGTEPALEALNAVSVRVNGANVIVSTGQSTYRLSPAQFLNAAATAYGADAISAVAAFYASKPSSGGGGGATTVTVSQTAAFGSTPPTITDYTTASGTITTTNVVYMMIENVGTTNATFTYGGVNYTLKPEDQREFTAYTDRTNGGKLSPFLTLSATGTATGIVRLLKIFKQ